MEKDIKDKALHWATSEEFDEMTRAEVQALLDSQNDEEIANRFYRDLEFGTGGMRGIMGAGTSRMNVYNIRKATTALGSYLKSFHDGKSVSVAISHDSRNSSRLYAETAARVLAALGVDVLLTKEMRPVPMLSYMVRKYDCSAGICITASHNPPEYNGFKVYWGTGGQLVPPHDREIVLRYQEIQGIGDLVEMPWEEAVEKKKIRLIGEELDECYFHMLRSKSIRQFPKEDFSIVYTPLHGTGVYAVPRALKENGFEKVSLVADQSEPDGNFPTVSSPNPEDPKALSMALEEARSRGADLVLGTDPDTDRIGAIVKDGDDYRIFNGNQLGSLLMDYVLGGLRASQKMPADPMVIKTVVTTGLQDRIAEHYGVHCEDTLTGFKWICDLIEQHESGKVHPKRNFVCGGEESYGFLAGTEVRDKDAVMACSLAAEMFCYFKSVGKSPSEAMDDLFARHGFYHEELVTKTFEGRAGAETISKLMGALRSEPPAELAGSATDKRRDWQEGYSYSCEGDTWIRGDKLEQPESNVLQFENELGDRLSARPSGTEPKIKFYFSVYEPCDASTLQMAKVKAEQRMSALTAQVDEFFERL